jgi:hypothetical protein
MRNRKMCRRLGRAVLGAGFVLVPIAAGAQLSYPTPRSKAGVELALSKPFLKGGDFGAASSLLTARFTVPAGQASLFAEWGVSHGSAGFDYYAYDSYGGVSWVHTTESGTTTANLALGVAFGKAEGTSGSFTFSVPVAHESDTNGIGTAVAVSGDPDHPERFVPHVWSTEGAVRFARRLESGASAGIRIAGVVMGYTEAGGNTDLYSRYAAFGSVPAGPVELGAEVSGMAIITQGDLSLSERTFHQLTISAGLPHTGAAPHLFVRLPLDHDLSEVVRATAGIRVSF